MERIVIEVSETTAKKWASVPANVKSELQKSFGKQIDAVAQDIETSDFKALLDKIGEEARKNGLTEDVLQQLLKDE